MNEKTPKKRGRPTKPESERYAERVEIRMTRQQREKLEKLGGAVWVRSRIDRAPMRSDSQGGGKRTQKN